MERVNQIKFRGLYQGVWVVGNFIVGKDSKGETFTQIERSDFNDFAQYQVDPETVGQFTGLTDKNGKEAYEGNLYKETLLTGEERYYKIFSVKGGFAINQFQDDFYKPVDEILFWQALSDMQTIRWFESCLEEIGNIQDNPELINNK